MTDVIERMARAICKAEHRLAWSVLDQEMEDDYRRMARAAYAEAMSDDSKQSGETRTTLRDAGDHGP